MKLAFSLSIVLPSLALTPRDGRDVAHDGTSLSVANGIQESYIVVFRKDVTNSSVASHLEWVDEMHQPQEYLKSELRKRSRVRTGRREQFDG